MRRPPPVAGAAVAGAAVAGAEFVGGELVGGEFLGGELVGGELVGGALSASAVNVSPSILYIVNLDFIAPPSEPFLAVLPSSPSCKLRQNVRENIQATIGVVQADPVNTH